MTEMQAVFLVVQEAPGETPSVASVPAMSGEAALARIPEMARDFFGEVPKQLRTWRIDRPESGRGPGPWVIYSCEWSSQAGEIEVVLRDVPANVIVLLMRYAGANDGVQSGLDSGRMLIDLNGADKSWAREFGGRWEGVGIETGALAKHVYTSAWESGINDALNAKYRQRLGRGGRS